MDPKLRTVLQWGVTIISLLMFIYLLTKPAPPDIKALMEVKQKQDSIVVLLSERHKYHLQDSLQQIVFEIRQHHLDSMLANLDKNKSYVKEINSVRHLSADSTVFVLSNNLSE